jgi:hypothetical protein
LKLESWGVHATSVPGTLDANDPPNQALSACRGRIEDGNRGTGGSDEQIDLRAAEEHAFGPSIGKLSHDAPVLPSRAFVQNADAKLGVDHVVNDPPVLFIRDEHLEPVVVR